MDAADEFMTLITSLSHTAIVTGFANSLSARWTEGSCGFADVWEVE
jgi:hypothetical protein